MSPAAGLRHTLPSSAGSGVAEEPGWELHPTGGDARVFEGDGGEADRDARDRAGGITL